MQTNWNQQKYGLTYLNQWIPWFKTSFTAKFRDLEKYNINSYKHQYFFMGLVNKCPKGTC